LTRLEPAFEQAPVVLRRFRQVDVFGVEPYTGNPVAVVLDADGVTTEEMERFTRWTNLSEATFVLPPSTADADYRVRIFTSAAATPNRPSAELPFAGHPTLGTCHAWLDAGGVPRDESTIVQECGAGLVRVRRADGLLAFAAPPLLRYEPAKEEIVDEIAASLRIERSDIVDATWVDNGPGWVCALLRDGDAVRALDPGFVRLDLGVAAVDVGGGVTVRAFFPRGGATAEDPVTGSLNAGVAQWLADAKRVSFPYVASQTTGRVDVSRDEDETIWVGGATVTCISGDCNLP
jgi:PhzF family phenazine biosynthesis protein